MTCLECKCNTCTLKASDCDSCVGCIMTEWEPLPLESNCKDYKL